MNRQRVIFVKNIDNAAAKSLSGNYNNVIFFTQDEENEQIWCGGKKCSGITRINKEQNVSISNYQYANINHYISESFTPHDIYIHKYKISFDYNSSIEEMVKHNEIIGHIEGNIDGANIVEYTYLGENPFRNTDISGNTIIISYRPEELKIGIYTIVITLRDKYNVDHTIYADILICPGEIVPFGTISVNLKATKTHIAVDESISIIPEFTYTTLSSKNTLPTLNILSEEWISSNNVVKISPDGLITGLYSSLFDDDLSKNFITTKITYKVTLNNYPEPIVISKDIMIDVYKKYLYFEPNFIDESMSDMTDRDRYNRKINTDISDHDISGGTDPSSPSNPIDRGSELYGFEERT